MTDDIDAIVRGLSKAQRKLVRAMPGSGRPKKWRAVYRHAKVRHWTQLGFAIARPTLTGSEYLTPLGIAVRNRIMAQKGGDV